MLIVWGFGLAGYREDVPLALHVGVRGPCLRDQVVRTECRTSPLPTPYPEYSRASSAGEGEDRVLDGPASGKTAPRVTAYKLTLGSAATACAISTRQVIKLNTARYLNQIPGSSPNVRKLLHMIFRTRLFYRVV
jgi:hypothetical protein